MGNPDNPRNNSEGYADVTAHDAIRSVAKAEKAIENKVSFLIKVLRFIANESGFEILNRIELQDKRTGREFR